MIYYLCHHSCCICMLVYGHTLNINIIVKFRVPAWVWNTTTTQLSLYSKFHLLPFFLHGQKLIPRHALTLYLPWMVVEAIFWYDKLITYLVVSTYYFTISILFLGSIPILVPQNDPSVLFYFRKVCWENTGGIKRGAPPSSAPKNGAPPSTSC